MFDHRPTYVDCYARLRADVVFVLQEAALALAPYALVNAQTNADDQEDCGPGAPADQILLHAMTFQLLGREAQGILLTIAGRYGPAP